SCEVGSTVGSRADSFCPQFFGATVLRLLEAEAAGRRGDRRARLRRRDALSRCRARRGEGPRARPMPLALTDRTHCPWTDGRPGTPRPRPDPAETPRTRTDTTARADPPP